MATTLGEALVAGQDSGFTGTSHDGVDVCCPLCGTFLRRGFYPLTGEVCSLCGTAFSRAGPGAPSVVRRPEGLACSFCGALLGKAPPGTAVMCASCGVWVWEPGDRDAEEAARDRTRREPHRSPCGGPLRPDVLGRVRMLVRSQCSAYQGSTGRCAYGRVCVYCGEGASAARCRWFELAVLPLDPELRAEYCDRSPAVREDGDRADGGERGLPAKPCAACGRGFVPASNRQRYCAQCAVRVRREAVARAVARHRARAAAKVVMSSRM